ncbi:MAG: glutamate-cysteine ligase family protein [Acidimicrobiales bacterium]
MGKDVAPIVFSRDDRLRYREKVRRGLDVFARMLAESRFDLAPSSMGLEIELNLTDADGQPVMRNAEVLQAIADEAFQTEVGQWNIEINVPPRKITGRGLAEFEHDVREDLNEADAKAADAGANIIMIGILPTLAEGHTTLETLSANPRYALLNEQIIQARGENLHIDIRGREELDAYADTVAPEGACTSVQIHLQVGPEEFASYWNASQAIAGVQVALAANSPFLYGRELWRETRIALFLQSIDTRPEELKTQGVRPRVWFGERWITSIFDLFEENVRYFPSLLPLCQDEDPGAVLEAGGTPQLAELRLHNGTIWRWNRPVYDVVAGVPHLRVENRVLPAGPTVVDIMANAAFYAGLVRVLAEDERPVWSRMSFTAAEDNFHEGAREGIDARMFWPGVGEAPVTELVLRRLLPLAREGLDRWEVDADIRDRLLGVIEQRCLTQRNGAAWQAEVVHAIDDGLGDRYATLAGMLRRYHTHMHTNDPVHTWPL